MPKRISILSALVVWSAMAAAAPARQANDTAAMLDRASRYVEDYEKSFAAIVSEEHQVQKIVRADGRVKRTRELRSDFLLIKTGPAWAQVFRDVIEVDGKPLRNREDRLRKLFLENPRTALTQARAIAEESARHNVGMNRTGNSPLLPLVFLHPREVKRSRFTLSSDTLSFEEFQTPSLMRTARGSRRFDLFARGSFVVEAATGRVFGGEFLAIGPPESYSASLAVRYLEDPQLKLMVPSFARERYWFDGKPKEDRVDVESRYSNFRRFQVSVEEKIKTPN